MFILLGLSGFSQDTCEDAINFFPRLTSINKSSADGATAKKILRSEIEDQDLKAIVKLEKHILKRSGNYASTLKTLKIVKAEGDKRIEYFVAFKLSFLDIEYRFNATCDSKGKIIGQVELPSLKGKSVQAACSIYNKGIQDPDLENVVGIRLVYDKNTLVYEVFQKGEALHTEKDYRSDIMRNKKSKHKIIRYNAFTGEKVGISTREHVVIK